MRPDFGFDDDDGLTDDEQDLLVVLRLSNRQMGTNEERIAIEAISGTSAGAMNAAALANGMRLDGRRGAMAALEAFVSRTGLSVF